MRSARRASCLGLALPLLAGAVASCGRGELPQTPPVTAAAAAMTHRDIVATETPRFSHANEEIIVRDFFQDRRGGVFLDVGCAHPVDDNNTYYLEKELGWSGIGVDALPEFAAKWRRRRPGSRFFSYIVTDHEEAAAPFYRAEDRVKDISSIYKPERAPGGEPVGSRTIQVPATTLTRLLVESNVSKVDFLSMDIEGAEPLALAGFDIERFKPELACIEAKPANRAKILDYFTSHGYERIEKYAAYDSTNYYFAPKARPAP